MGDGQISTKKQNSEVQNDKSALTKSNYVKTSKLLDKSGYSNSNANLHSNTGKQSKIDETDNLDIVEKLMRKHEAMVKQVMKQKDHLARNFTSKVAKSKLKFNKTSTDTGTKIPNSFEAAKKAHQ